MKLEVFDAYNIRARLSVSILVLAPIAITLFSIFDETRSFATSSIIIFVLLALTNYVPILQRRISKWKEFKANYAADMLLLQDKTFDTVTKNRYYKKLASLNEAFSLFMFPDDSEKFHKCCESAVLYLRSHTRENQLVQEENINYGFCKNLLSSKPAGIIICLICLSFATGYSICNFGSISNIPVQNYLALISDLVLFFFWVFGINSKILELAAKRYAKAIIMAIDTIDNK